MRNEWQLLPTFWYGVGVGLPTSDCERIDSLVPDELPTVMTGIRIKECFGVWRVKGHSLNEAIGVHPPFQMESDYTVDLTWWSNGRMWGFQTNNRHICRGRKCNLPRRIKSATALSLPKRERKVRAETWVWERIVLMVRIRAFTRSAGTLTIFCWVRNSIPINVNCCIGIKSDFFRFGMKPRFCTVWSLDFVWEMSIANQISY